MDNLTHTLAGAALGEAGLKRRSGLAMAALMIGANLPDLDVLAIPFGRSLVFRRGWTHGPIALVVLPVALTLLLVAWDRWQARRGRRPATRPPVRPRELLLLAFAGVLSHPFLDWLNTYGVRLLMPFSDRWFHGDGIFIVDPWIWLALGLGVALARRGAGAVRPARVALGAVAAYVALMLAGSGLARAAAERHVRAVEGTPPRRVMAGPVPLHPLRRQLIVDMGAHYRFGTVAWRPGTTVTLEPVPLPTNAGHPAVAATRDAPPMRDFLYWSRFPFFTVEATPDGAVVHAGDARFARRPGGWSGVRVAVPGAAAAPE